MWGFGSSFPRAPEGGYTFDWLEIGTAKPWIISLAGSLRLKNGPKEKRRRSTWHREFVSNHWPSIDAKCISSFWLYLIGVRRKPAHLPWPDIFSPSPLRDAAAIMSWLGVTKVSKAAKKILLRLKRGKVTGERVRRTNCNTTINIVTNRSNVS